MSHTIRLRKDWKLPKGDKGKSISIICSPDTEGCGFVADVQVRSTPENYVREMGKPDPDARTPEVASCPECGKAMTVNLAVFRFGFAMRGNGFSETKCGMRRKREFTKRNERLKTTQWDNHEPQKLTEGIKPRNPTPGGPYDPNGPFASKKTKSLINLPPGTEGKSKKPPKKDS